MAHILNSIKSCKHVHKYVQMVIIKVRIYVCLVMKLVLRAKIKVRIHVWAAFKTDCINITHKTLEFVKQTVVLDIIMMNIIVKLVIYNALHAQILQIIHALVV